MAQKILGIDLGTYSLKVVRLERKMNDVAILDYFEEPLHPHSRLSHPEQVKLALEKLMSAHDLAADVVSASFPGQLLSARILEIPVTNPRKIHQMVDFELESYVPFALEELFSDHHILSFAEGAARVLSVYTNEKNIGTYIEALAQVNLEPKYFGADFTDLAALCSVSMVPPEGYFVLCDMGHSKTNLVILKDRQVIYTRTLGVAGLHFTKAIQRIFNINFEKAEAIKLSRGKLILRDDESDQVSRLMNRVAQDLISGIRQTFLGVKHVYPDFNVQAIYCTGGTSRLIGILDFLSFHLKTNVFELEPLEFIEHNLSDVEDVECLIGQSLAAALRPIYSTRVPRINLRKGPYAYRQDFMQFASEFKSALALVVILLFFVSGYYIFATQYYDMRISDLVKKIESQATDKGLVVKSRKSKDKVADKTLSSLKKIVDSAKSKMGDGGASALNADPVILMNDLVSALPPKSEVNFEVREFVFADNFLRLNATTNDTLNVEKITAALKQSGLFGTIEAGDAQAKPNNRWDFTLKIYLASAANDGES